MFNKMWYWCCDRFLVYSVDWQYNFATVTIEKVDNRLIKRLSNSNKRPNLRD
jgi:hypothetical protein